MSKLIELLDSLNVQCNWNTLYVGYSLKVITADEIQRFAVDFLVNDDVPVEVNELAWGIDESSMKLYLMKVVQYVERITDDDKEKRKIRLALLEHAKAECNTEELLKKIEEVYSTFDYPKEMEMLIYYMPYEPLPEDKGLSGTERILRDFDIFLSNEIRELKSDDIII